MDLVKDFYLLHFCHSLLPFYIGVSRRVQKGRCTVLCAAAFPANKTIYNALRLSGCGTQHPHRALGGTRVLLAAAPTTPPCFRRWRRSSSLHFAHKQRNCYFIFRVYRALRSAINAFSQEGSQRQTAVLPVSAQRLRGFILVKNKTPKHPQTLRCSRIQLFFLLIPARSAGRIPPAVPAQGRGS